MTNYMRAIASSFIICLVVFLCVYRAGVVSVPFVQKTVQSDELLYAFDSIEVRDEMLSVAGYCIMGGDLQWSPWNRKSLLLVDELTGETSYFRATDYAYGTNQEIWGYGEQKYCGFLCSFKVSQFRGHAMRVEIAYQRSGVLYRSTTGYVISDSGELLFNGVLV